MAASSGEPACPSHRADPARVSGCPLVRLVSCALSLDLPMPTHHHIGQFGRLDDVHGQSGVHNSRLSETFLQSGSHWTRCWKEGFDQKYQAILILGEVVRGVLSQVLS